MIISDKFNFVFIHIPKCGGTTFRGSIKKYDDTNGYFTGKIESHNEYGTLNYVHLPLFMVKRIFPKIFNKIKVYDSIAIVRDPYQRFTSSLAQHINRYREDEIHKLSDKRILVIAHDVVDNLKKYKGEDLLPVEYIHFQQQINYIYLGDEKCVKHIFKIKDIKSAIELIQNKTGELITNESLVMNKTIVYKNSGIRQIIKLLNNAGLKPILNPIYSKTMHLFVGDKSKINKLILEDNKVNNFITSFYREDIKIYEKLK
jgi:hypothetical protein